MSMTDLLQTILPVGTSPPSLLLGDNSPYGDPVLMPSDCCPNKTLCYPIIIDVPSWDVGMFSVDTAGKLTFQD